VESASAGGFVGASSARNELINPALQWLATMDGPAFNRVFRGSPLERTRRKRILRNVAIAMGNSGEREFLPQLDAWARATIRCSPRLRHGRPIGCVRTLLVLAQMICR
jgi:epoxyqueuosine reductase QueG